MSQLKYIYNLMIILMRVKHHVQKPINLKMVLLSFSSPLQFRNMIGMNRDMIESKIVDGRVDFCNNNITSTW